MNIDGRSQCYTRADDHDRCEPLLPRLLVCSFFAAGIRVIESERAISVILHLREQSSSGGAGNQCLRVFLFACTFLSRPTIANEKREVNSRCRNEIFTRARARLIDAIICAYLPSDSAGRLKLNACPRLSVSSLPPSLSRSLCFFISPSPLNSQSKRRHFQRARARTFASFECFSRH